MEALIGQYYGIDLIAMVLTFFGIYQLGNQKRNGFVIHVFGNLVWLIVGILTQSVGLVLANIAFTAMNIRGYYQWRKAHE